MSQEVDSGYDALLNSSGPAQLDYLNAELTAKTLLGTDASPYGLVSSLLHGRIGSMIDAVGPFVPGQDAPHNIDLVNTYASNGRPMARKVLANGSPARLHVALDMPKRLNSLTGNYNAGNISKFILSLCGRVAEVTASDILIYHNNGESAGLLYEGGANDIYYAFNQLEGKAKRHLTDKAKPTLKELLKVVSSNTDAQNDAIFVVSDFLDEFNNKNKTFGWEQSIKSGHSEYGDRMWATRITSPAQRQITPGINDVISLDTLENMTRSFADTAKVKNDRINSTLEPIRSLNVDTFRNNQNLHPVSLMTRFILGTLAQ